MPRTTEEILADAERLAAIAEAYEPSEAELAFSKELASVFRAVINRAGAEKELVQAVTDARKAGAPWRDIGQILGTSGEAARQRFGKLAA